MGDFSLDATSYGRSRWWGNLITKGSDLDLLGLILGKVLGLFLHFFWRSDNLLLFSLWSLDWGFNCGIFHLFF